MGNRYEDKKRLKQAQKVCADLYQAIGYLAFNEEGDLTPSDDDWIVLLDNLSDVITGNEPRHESYSWPRGEKS